MGDPLSILVAGQAFPPGGEAIAAAKLGLLAGSAEAGAMGAALLALAPAPITPSKESGA